MDPFVAEIRIFPFNFAPKGWAFCDGQILPLRWISAVGNYGWSGRGAFRVRVKPDREDWWTKRK